MYPHDKPKEECGVFGVIVKIKQSSLHNRFATRINCNPTPAGNKPQD